MSHLPHIKHPEKDFFLFQWRDTAYRSFLIFHSQTVVFFFCKARSKFSIFFVLLHLNSVTISRQKKKKTDRLSVAEATVSTHNLFEVTLATRIVLLLAIVLCVSFLPLYLLVFFSFSLLFSLYCPP